jgi:hypothetical protein
MLDECGRTQTIGIVDTLERPNRRLSPNPKSVHVQKQKD